MQDLIIGRTLGHYRIVEKIGAGGMGEVYRAHDQRLDRDVAVKVLPEAVAEDAQRLARFEREAKLLASLSHQNIATLFGLEEHDGQRFLIMELVEGETLAERLKTGPIPVDDALPVALQIAEGLEAAHEYGIIHRDLKPANVMVSPEGKVKVLDFGLAKAFDPEASSPMSPESLAESPTLTADLTRGGVLLGTAPYMSPEQARGKPVDKRADVWSFGVLLWETLTGTRLFDGKTTSDILAAVLRAEPDWQELPPGTPPAVRRLLRRCLERDGNKRLHDVADARLEIEEALAHPDRAWAQQSGLPEPGLWESLKRVWPVVLAAIAVNSLLVGGVVWLLSEAPTTTPGRPTRVALSLPPGVTIDTTDQQPVLAMSPDGRWLVFVGEKDGSSQLYRRDLEQFDAIPIPATEGGYHPFFSPDGRWVGFFADGKLKKIPLAGGPPQIIAEAPSPFGTSWGPDGTIVFNRRFGEGLWRVPSAGGTPEVLTTPDLERGESWFVWPESLPDGQSVLFTNTRGFTVDEAQIEVLDLESHARKTVIEDGSYARYVPTGHLVFGHGAGIHVAPFDAERREVTGPSVPVPEPIFYDFENGLPHLALSTAGSLAFVPGAGSPRRQLVSVDLEGRETPLIEARRSFAYPRFSPDGERLAFNTTEPGDTNIWVLNLSTGTQTKLTLEGSNNFPVWTPDGERVTFRSRRGGVSGIYWKRADGSGESEPLVLTGKVGETFIPNSWSPDGNTLVFQRLTPAEAEIQSDLWIATRDGDREPLPLVATGALEGGAAVSPDGRWLAYKSNESGRYEIYVQPFPGGGERHQVSTDGALPPVWSKDGQTVFFQTEDQVLAVPISTSPRFRAEAPRVLLDAEYDMGTYRTHPNFDIAPDGKSFVMVKPDEDWGRATEVKVILNWFEELKRLAPTE
jgi:serine/threonine protein kinase/Tol biopolymer transport system component